MTQLTAEKTKKIAKIAYGTMAAYEKLILGRHSSTWENISSEYQDNVTRLVVAYALGYTHEQCVPYERSLDLLFERKMVLEQTILLLVRTEQARPEKGIETLLEKSAKQIGNINTIIEEMVFLCVKSHENPTDITLGKEVWAALVNGGQPTLAVGPYDHWTPNGNVNVHVDQHLDPDQIVAWVEDLDRGYTVQQLRDLDREPTILLPLRATKGIVSKTRRPQ